MMNLIDGTTAFPEYTIDKILNEIGLDGPNSGVRKEVGNYLIKLVNEFDGDISEVEIQSLGKAFYDGFKARAELFLDAAHNEFGWEVDKYRNTSRILPVVREHFQPNIAQ